MLETEVTKECSCATHEDLLLVAITEWATNVCKQRSMEQSYVSDSGGPSVHSKDVCTPAKLSRQLFQRLPQAGSCYQVAVMIPRVDK